MGKKLRFFFLVLSGLLVAGNAIAEEGALGTAPDLEVADYFDQIVNHTENGDIAFFSRRWVTDINVVVHGEPDEELADELNRVVADLNTLIAPLKIQIVEADGDIDLFFAPVGEFKNMLPQYKAYNPGFHWVWWDENGAIGAAAVLVSTTHLSRPEQLHILREELTQSLGFLNDSTLYPDSIFYRGWSKTREFSALDRAVIQQLYSTPTQMSAGYRNAGFEPQNTDQD